MRSAYPRYSELQVSVSPGLSMRGEGTVLPEGGQQQLSPGPLPLRAGLPAVPQAHLFGRCRCSAPLRQVGEACVPPPEDLLPSGEAAALPSASAAAAASSSPSSLSSSTAPLVPAPPSTEAPQPAPPSPASTAPPTVTNELDNNVPQGPVEDSSHGATAQDTENSVDEIEQRPTPFAPAAVATSTSTSTYAPPPASI
ncbi:Protein of unknown function, partial [Gryllus bimaculatus]